MRSTTDSGDVCVDMSGGLLAGSVGTGGTVGTLGAVDGSEHDGAGGVVGLSVVGTVVHGTVSTI